MKSVVELAAEFIAEDVEESLLMLSETGFMSTCKGPQEVDQSRALALIKVGLSSLRLRTPSNRPARDRRVALVGTLQ